MGAVNQIDLSVWQWMLEHRSDGATSFFSAITTLCNPLTVVVLVAVTGVGLILSAHQVLAWRLVGCVAGAWLTATALKLTVGRSRPPVADRLIVVAEYSFPSGHATQSIALWSSLALVALALIGRRSEPWMRGVAGVVAVTVAVLVGVSRLYLGVHWLSDVVGGWMVGAIWLWLSWRGVDRLRLGRRLADVGDSEHVENSQDGTPVSGRQRRTGKALD